MCGLTGFIDVSRSRDSKELEHIISNMSDTLRHRGPDDQGVWVDASYGVALGHNRLSIIDTSVAGHQPMVSVCGRYVIVLNGEIYNFKFLAKDLELKGYKFRGHSDTEVMLAAISHFGVEQAIEKFNGMFAFALWDRQERKLYLCRDRLGEKPLYYGFINKNLVIGSELKAFKKFPGFTRDIDRQALTLYLRYNCIPAPYSIYTNIKKVLPGELLTISAPSMKITKQFYWSLQDKANSFDQVRGDKSFEEVTQEAEILLKDAVKIRMESDVPLGVFLSGGIDSTLVTALMQSQSSNAIKSFTIGFGDERYNEEEEAGKIAGYLGTEHTSFYASAKDALKVIPDLPKIYDEPFSDSSQIPTVLVSRMAKQFVTVCLSGDGGDEIFAGYNRYLWLEKIWRKVGFIPNPLRKILVYMFAACPPDKFELIFEKIKPLLPSGLRMRNSGIKFQKLLDVLSSGGIDSAYMNLASHWKYPEQLVLGIEPNSKIADSLLFGGLPKDYKRQMMYYDTLNYLPNDILVKVDRASMSTSLESRAVYLDHRLVEYSWGLPTHMLISRSETKLILRNILKKYVPLHFWERPKMGFAVPIDSWLRGPLKDWAHDLLSRDRLQRDGFFDYRQIVKKWDQHRRGANNWQFELWDILMFNSWLEDNK
ncbi:MAG: asparagine synthase (glutamine-hydrolyzing) [Candidatus Omnitrophica bacterium]|nr:asparagine synthase (glutamine-hydrolyzing) [Candidatus Omnitrophota bacterium]